MITNEQLMGFNKYLTELSAKMEEYKEVVADMLMLFNSIEDDRKKMAKYINTLYKENNESIQ